jgi:HPt (histidine-containing phosphotransfer) domain-containing protein
MATLLVDREQIAEIRFIERATGRVDLFSSLVLGLERNLAQFDAAFSACLGRGDSSGAARAAHTLKGACGQLGAQALGELFDDIERCAKAGDSAEAKRRFEAAAPLIAQSLEALKQA